MAVNENDLDLLHTYLDGELPVSECEGLLRRLSVEPDLASELDQLRAEHAIRQAAWPTLEPAESTVARMETNVLRSARRHDVMVVLRRSMTIVTSVAACLLFGFTVGWLGRDRYLGMPGSAGAAPAAGVAMVSQNKGGSTTGRAGGFVVNVRDDSGHLVAVQQFNSLDEARQFADDVARAQANRQDTHDSVVVPAVAKF